MLSLLKYFLTRGWPFIIIGVVAILTLVASVGYSLLPSPIIQPIQINHKIHLESEPPEGQEKITCQTCHKYYDTRIMAGRPFIKTCLSCHATSSEKKEKKPELDKILEYDKRGEEISWKRIYDIPDHVFFSHRRHTRLPKYPAEGGTEGSVAVSLKEEQDKHSGKQVWKPIECEVCHGPIAETVTPPTAPLNEIIMEFCINCHKQESASVDCIACHR